MHRLTLLGVIGCAACALPSYQASELGARARDNEIATHYALAEQIINITGRVNDMGFLAEGTDLVTRFDGSDGAVTRIIHGVEEPTPYLVLDDAEGGTAILCVFNLFPSEMRAGAGRAQVGDTVVLRGVVQSVRHDSILVDQCMLTDVVRS